MPIIAIFCPVAFRVLAAASPAYFFIVIEPADPVVPAFPIHSFRLYRSSPFRTLGHPFVPHLPQSRAVFQLTPSGHSLGVCIRIAAVHRLA